MTSWPGCVSGCVWVPPAVSMSCSRDTAELWTWSLLWLRMSSFSSNPRDASTSHTLAVLSDSLWSSGSPAPATLCFITLTWQVSALTILLISVPQPASGSSQGTASSRPPDRGHSVSLSVTSSWQALRATGLSQSTRPPSRTEITPNSTTLLKTAAKSASSFSVWVRGRSAWSKTAPKGWFRAGLVPEFFPDLQWPGKASSRRSSAKPSVWTLTSQSRSVLPRNRTVRTHCDGRQAAEVWEGLQENQLMKYRTTARLEKPSVSWVKISSSRLTISDCKRRKVC